MNRTLLIFYLYNGQLTKLFSRKAKPIPIIRCWTYKKWRTMFAATTINLKELITKLILTTIVNFLFSID